MMMYEKTFSGQPAVQVESEFSAFLTLVQKYKVKSYLEIGTARGDTFHEVVSHMPEGSKAVAVDMPESNWGLGGSKTHLSMARKDLREKGYSVNIVWGDSRYPNVIEETKRHGRFDLVFIDGDHTYDGVKSDFENYGSMGKIIAFHDIADRMRPNRKGEKIEVPIFWNEIKKHYKHLEFIAPNSTMGIGVIFVDARS